MASRGVGCVGALVGAPWACFGWLVPCGKYLCSVGREGDSNLFVITGVMGPMVGGPGIIMIGPGAGNIRYLVSRVGSNSRSERGTLVSGGVAGGGIGWGSGRLAFVFLIGLWASYGSHSLIESSKLGMCFVL